MKKLTILLFLFIPSCSVSLPKTIKSPDLLALTRELGEEPVEVELAAIERLTVRDARNYNGKCGDSKQEGNQTRPEEGAEDEIRKLFLSIVSKYEVSENKLNYDQLALDIEEWCSNISTEGETQVSSVASVTIELYNSKDASSFRKTYSSYRTSKSFVVNKKDVELSLTLVMRETLERIVESQLSNLEKNP